jgi:hypothetical protein
MVWWWGDVGVSGRWRVAAVRGGRVVNSRAELCAIDLLYPIHRYRRGRSRLVLSAGSRLAV